MLFQSPEKVLLNLSVGRGKNQLSVGSNIYSVIAF